MFERIKKYYDLNLYSANQVKLFMEKGYITENEYEMIILGSAAEDEELKQRDFLIEEYYKNKEAMKNNE